MILSLTRKVVFKMQKKSGLGAFIKLFTVIILSRYVCLLSRHTETRSRLFTFEIFDSKFIRPDFVVESKYWPALIQEICNVLHVKYNLVQKLHSLDMHCCLKVTFLGLVHLLQNYCVTALHCTCSFLPTHNQGLCTAARIFVLFFVHLEYHMYMNCSCTQIMATLI